MLYLLSMMIDGSRRPGPSSRLDSVQMLRAIAAVTVVTHHVSFFQNGEWGVDLFFVISGFIMCYVTETSGRQFFAKRLIRIVPLYWAGTIGVYCIALVKPALLMNTTTSVSDLVKSLAFIPFRKGDRIFPVLFLGWTLNYEMFFYLLFALSMRISHRNRAALASALILAIAAAGQLVHFDAVPVRFLAKPIILEFAFGMLCYSLLAPHALDRREDASILSRILWTSAGALLIACMPIATGILPFEDRVIRWGIFAALSFYCVVNGLAGLRLPWWLVIVGDASYSLYLFHPYVMQTFNEIFGAFARPDLRGYCMAIIAILLCCVLAVLCYQFVEKPVSGFLRRTLLDRRPRAAKQTAASAPDERPAQVPSSGPAVAVRHDQ